jgi:hypothetical protein
MSVLLFQRNIADDKGAIAVTLFEVEVLRKSVEWFKGKREVRIA